MIIIPSLCAQHHLQAGNATAPLPSCQARAAHNARSPFADCSDCLCIMALSMQIMARQCHQKIYIYVLQVPRPSQR